jgi:hypothetical protein
LTIDNPLAIFGDEVTISFSFTPTIAHVGSKIINISGLINNAYAF